MSNTDNDFDRGALNGLRGWFAFHVMVNHAWSDNPQLASPRSVIHLYGDLVMPLFFLISGFSLALRYGRIKWNGIRSTATGLMRQPSFSGGDELPSNLKIGHRTFDKYTFYRKRLVKIFPVHILGIVLSLILWNFRYELSYSCYFLKLTMV